MNGRGDDLREDDEFQQFEEEDDEHDVERQGRGEDDEEDVEEGKNEEVGEEKDVEEEDVEEKEELDGENNLEERDLEEGEKVEEGLDGSSSQEPLTFGSVGLEEGAGQQQELEEQSVPPPVKKPENAKLGEEVRLGFINDDGDGEERTFQDTEEKPAYRRYGPLLIAGLAVLAIIVLTGVGVASATSSSSSALDGSDSDGNFTTDSPVIPPTSEPSFSPTSLNSTLPPVISTDTPTSPPISGAGNSTGEEGNQTSAPTGFNETRVPTTAPTLFNETGVPTFAPTSFNDTGIPTFAPTSFNDTGVPTFAPTSFNNTGVPTVAPTSFNDTGVPTTAPTSFNDTGIPTIAPTSFNDTGVPTIVPTSFNDTGVPTVPPTTATPTIAPTNSPTVINQTFAPTDEDATDAPSPSPTTGEPTSAPTTEAEAVPTYAPTRRHYPPWWPWDPKYTKAPTPAPPPGGNPTTSSPTALPTISPTRAPSTDQPTNSPTTQPTPNPTIDSSTNQPTNSPTTQPTSAPTTDGSSGADYIRVVFTDESNLSPSVRVAFEQAASRWSNILRSFRILEDNVPPGFNFNSGAGCSLEQDVPIPEGPITGLTIAAEVVPIDGVGSVLGRAGFCAIFANKEDDPNVFVPLIGQMTFDSADLANLELSGSLESVILHEMGHVLGIGTLWNVNFLNFEPLIIDPVLSRNGLIITGNPNNSPEYIGVNGLAGFQQLGGGSGNILVEDGSFAGLSDAAIRAGQGAGSIDSHWRETTFENELMTPAINTGTDNPLTIMSIRSLEDLGYDVDVSFADSFVIPGTDPTQPLERDSGKKIDMGSDVITPSDDNIRTGIDRARSRALSVQNGKWKLVSAFH